MAEGTANTRRRGTRSQVLRLPAQLGSADVAGFKPVLTAALDGGRPLLLDATALEHIDGAGLQLLLAFHAALQAGGRRLDWQGPSSVLLEAARLCGVHDTLGLTA